MSKVLAESSHPYAQRFRGLFYGMMRWQELDLLWQTVKRQMDDSWYVYAIGHEVPDTTSDAATVIKFLDEIDLLLHKEHEEDYCGIVYVDDPEAPTFIKIFDPNNLGVSCGFSENPPLPGWVMSKMPPCDLEAVFPPPKGRQRWWNKIFS